METQNNTTPDPVTAPNEPATPNESVTAAPNTPTPPTEITTPEPESTPSATMPESTPEPTVATPPPPAATPVVKTPSKKRRILTVILLILLSIAVGAAAYFGITTSRAKQDAAKLKEQLTELETTTHDIPEGAILVSECVPNMGHHYLAEGGDEKYGPFYLVSKSGRVIGIEYMFSQDMLTAIPNVTPAVEVMIKDSPMNNWKFDHTEMSRAPEGHPGFEEDHIDVHNYTVTPEQRKLACV